MIETLRVLEEQKGTVFGDLLGVVVTQVHEKPEPITYGQDSLYTEFPLDPGFACDRFPMVYVGYEAEPERLFGTWRDSAGEPLPKQYEIAHVTISERTGFDPRLRPKFGALNEFANTRYSLTSGGYVLERIIAESCRIPDRREQPFARDPSVHTRVDTRFLSSDEVRELTQRITI